MWGDIQVAKWKHVAYVITQLVWQAMAVSPTALACYEALVAFLINSYGMQVLPGLDFTLGKVPRCALSDAVLPRQASTPSWKLLLPHSRQPYQTLTLSYSLTVSTVL